MIKNCYWYRKYYWNEYYSSFMEFLLRYFHFLLIISRNMWFFTKNEVLTPKITEIWQILMKTFNYLKKYDRNKCYLSFIRIIRRFVYSLFIISRNLCFSLLNALFTPKCTHLLQMWNKMVIYMNTTCIIKINIFCHLFKTFSLF